MRKDLIIFWVRLCSYAVAWICSAGSTRRCSNCPWPADMGYI